jgi:hypothetical protein
MQRSPDSQLSSAEVALNNNCLTCRNLNPDFQRKLGGDHVSSDYIRFDRRLDDLLASCKSGCRFCLVLLQVVQVVRHISSTLSDWDSITITLRRGVLNILFPGNEPTIEIYSPHGKLNRYS